MVGRFSTFACRMGVSFLFLAAVLSAGKASAQPAAENRQQIKKWVRQLDDNRFIIREMAQEKLIEAGAKAIPPLKASAPGAGLEFVSRSMYVLRQLALSEDVNTQQAASKALEDLAQGVATSAARRARATLAAVAKVRQNRALQSLEKLGAHYTKQDTRISAPLRFNGPALEIDEKWQGRPEDLSQLQWLVDIERVLLSGPWVNDKVLQHAAFMKSLKVITIKRAKITDAGVNHLLGFPDLRHLEIMYSPISDQSLEKLAQLKNVSLLKLFGTKITKNAAAKLQTQLAVTTIDFRHGAFLGVGCDNIGGGCRIRTVHPDSSAEKAGLSPGDIIIEYNGQQVFDFEGLTQLISKNTAGETIELKVVRGFRTTLTKKVVLGEWD